MARDFNKWLNGFRGSIADYTYYSDFEKVYMNVDAIKIELNILNSLIGSKNINKDFRELAEKYPEIIKVIPILIAKRETEIYCQDQNGGVTYHFKDNKKKCYKTSTIDSIEYFMQETGLFDLLQNRIISNLIDYVTGVEVGLDSNARKSRSGDLMENLVEAFIQESGFVKNKDYFKEMKLSMVEKKWSIDLSAISNFGKTEKKFDFVIKTDSMIYGIEANYYSTQGSKPNETARSYKMIAVESKEISGFKFVWFTDGQGWIPSRNNLEETFDVMEHIYNIQDLENGIITEVFK